LFEDDAIAVARSLEPPPGLSKTERTEWFKINKPQSQAKLKQPRARAAWFRGITLIYFCFLKECFEFVYCLPFFVFF
jgi:hypothetical protein